MEALGRLPPGRKLVAVAGPPGAGKSTVSALLKEELTYEGHAAVVVPMDGFHLDNRLLDARGLRHRKGAPETFDAAGFLHLVERIERGERGIVYPVFDRPHDIAIAGAAVLPDDPEVIIFEGNYLLLKEEPWSALARHWTHSFWVSAPEAEIHDRLMRRWDGAGLPEEIARQKVEGNDIPNMRFIAAHSRAADTDLSPMGSVQPAG